MESRRMRWTGHIACIGMIRNEYKICLDNLKGTDHSGDLVVDGRITLEWILGK
jgi:hypothetical protein